MIATTATEIRDYITAETMINGTAPVFRTRDKVTGRFVTITAATLMSRVGNATEHGVAIREGLTVNGETMFEIHDGASVYGRYIAA